MFKIAFEAEEDYIPRAAYRPNRGAIRCQGDNARGRAAAIFDARRSDSAGRAGAYKRLESQVSVFLKPRGERSSVALARRPHKALHLYGIIICYCRRVSILRL